jgi:Fic family protein
MTLAVSSWRQLLDGISRTHTTRPPVGNVVDIPNVLDRLKDAIKHKLRERDNAEAELHGIHEAMDTLEKEITAALEKNTLRRRDVMIQLNKLQQEMAAQMAELEIRCDVPMSPQAIFKQEGDEP